MKARKILVSLAALALVAAISVGGTLAYLTSQATVKNTFTVGSVGITMKEADVDTNGDLLYVQADKTLGTIETETLAERVTENTYNLMPGHTYVKDPKITVDKDSEDSWLFVKVENGIEQIEIKDATSAHKTIAAQMSEIGWTLVTGTQNIYKYKQIVTKDESVNVFNNFTVDGEANTANYGDKTITITAYAVQADGFATADAAWSATFGK